jgi:hypothetical protein
MACFTKFIGCFLVERRSAQPPVALAMCGCAGGGAVSRLARRDADLRGPRKLLVEQIDSSVTRNRTQRSRPAGPAVGRYERCADSSSGEGSTCRVVRGRIASRAPRTLLVGLADFPADWNRALRPAGPTVGRYERLADADGSSPEEGSTCWVVRGGTARYGLRTLLVGAADFLQPHSSAISAARSDALPEVVQ